MRLLMVSHFFASHGGGIELVAGHLEEELGALGHEIRWAAADEGVDPGIDVTRRIKLHCIDWLERFSGLPMPIPLPSAIRRLWSAAQHSDGIIVHDALYFSSILAVLAARRHGKQVILIQHIAEIPFSSPVMRAIMTLATRVVTRPMLRAADQVVFISATVRDAFANVRLRTLPHLLFNGVDSSIFRPANARGGVVEEPAARKTILFVGRFVEKKGLSILAELARQRSDLHLLLVGRGPIDPNSWNLSNVKVLPYQSAKALADLYREVDLLILPSVGEGYPLVVQEAMASGLPVICSADTAQADPAAATWLTGVSVDLTNVVATAERVSSAIDSSALPLRTRAAMAEYAAQAYSWKAMARDIVRLIDPVPDR
jgi:starch synthase